MTSPPTPRAGRPDARELRRRRNLADVQDIALALFARQGYAETTIEQVCGEAGISPATFYRWFSRKEDVVLFDRVDPDLFAAVIAAPPQLRVVEACTHAVRTVWAQMGEADRERELLRLRLSAGVPEVRAGLLEGMAAMMRGFTEAVHVRTGLPVTDPRPAVWAGAVVGCWISMMAEPFLCGAPEALWQRLDELTSVVEEQLPF